MLIGPPTAEALAVSTQMRDAWTGFATNGDPGWPRFETGAAMLFDATPAVAAYLEQVSRSIWTDYPPVFDLL